ncbi:MULTISPECIES: LLM class flavin-dependent oxidoreductase [Rhizobium]|uniref:Flavin-dependent oxidoreductase n=1 Tax=Rhizobium hidalgonense TaxID=1538159 RepID=A0ABX4JGE7_9HYPH|nr:MULTISPECIES: LLM class flavin-dependent oxidoreductase [Rhizobium]OWV66903.1 luciferase [Rhizobium sp. N122]PCD64015.1 flavin-dependent oxidoreductase [Rhizobium phaseoli]PDT04555.1 flavin-dependent oxidoreductase [Rhizobium sp. M1]PDT19125.1 flavin-dependent oxidoreductase [Rhizobium hidalgonense]PON04132.1 luciferase [Rhizobium hidalgonense]
MTNSLPAKLMVGIFDHLDEDGREIARQYEDRMKLAEVCDRLGFYGYHVAEHHCTPHGRGPSPNLFLASVAQRTQHLRLGPLVMLLNLYHPLRAFEEICMLDHLSGGRLELGMGRGSLPIEWSFFGIDEEVATSRYLEASEIVIQAMKEGAQALSYKGDHFELDKVPLMLRPHQRPQPPTWITTSRPEVARWAAENDTNLACGGPASAVRQITDAYRAHERRTAGGRKRAPFLGLVRMVVAGSTTKHAISLAAPAYQRWLRSFRFLYEINGIQTPQNLPPDFDAAVDCQLCVVGTAASVRQDLLDHVEEAGANYLLCQLAFGDLPLEASYYTATSVHSGVMA